MECEQPHVKPCGAQSTEAHSAVVWEELEVSAGEVMNTILYRKYKFTYKGSDIPHCFLTECNTSAVCNVPAIRHSLEYILQSNACNSLMHHTV